MCAEWCGALWTQTLETPSRVPTTLHSTAMSQLDDDLYGGSNTNFPVLVKY